MEGTSLSSDCVAQLVEHLAIIPKLMGSIPTVVRHIFQLTRCEYRLRVIPKHQETIKMNICVLLLFPMSIYVLLLLFSHEYLCLVITLAKVDSPWESATH